MSRQFKTSVAKRERVPLLVGLAGPSGGGKTLSSLRLATGMQRVVGGDIHFIDTESRRALHYADSFTFHHTPLQAPFSPLEYLAAIEHVQKQGAGIIIVDSMSHEHDGQGGVLEMHDTELDRIAGDDWQKRNKMNFTAWQRPKADRRKLINAILQLGINGIFCFRAREKLKIRPGQDPVPLGWMPIAGEEFVFEMTCSVLLPPAAGGVPEWQPEMPGEKQMIKLPRQFEEIFSTPRPLDEDHGEAMARWAEGDAKPAKSKEPPLKLSDKDLGNALDRIAAADDWPAVEAVIVDTKQMPWTTEQRNEIKAAINTRRKELGGE